MRFAFLILALSAGAAVGCGVDSVLLNVDVDSFMDEEDRMTSYDVPPVPGVLPPVTAVFGPASVAIPEGLDDVAEVEEADVTVRVVVDNEAGDGDITVRLYFAPDGIVPFTREPAAIVQTAFSGAGQSTVEETIELTETVRELFEASRVSFGYDVTVSGTSAATGIRGSVEVQEIRLRVLNDPSLGS